MRALAPLTLWLALATSAAWANMPPPMEASQCTTAADCTITTFNGCCGTCCGAEPRAMARRTLERQQQVCAVVECPEPDCSNMPCAAPRPASDFRADCQRGQCTRVQVAPARPVEASCNAHSDCVVSTTQCCGGCCPPMPRALTRAQQAGLEAQCQAVRCASPACTSKAVCRPVPSPSRLSARCEDNRCTLVSADAPPPRPPPPPPPPADLNTCRADSDCVAGTFACCGECCPSDAQPMTQAARAQREAVCARKSCPARECAATPCAPGRGPEFFTPYCRGGRCVLAERGRRPPPPAQCAEDAQCTLHYPAPGPSAACHQSPCGCCPGTEAIAVPVNTPLPPSPMRRPPPPSSQSAANTPFGLSQGGQGPAQNPPACAPCAAPQPSRAVCRGGRCRAERLPR